VTVALKAAAQRASRAAEVLLVVAALGALCVLVVRITSWSNCWRLANTEGREAPGIYALWRVLHGHALYESPIEPPYSLTLYNFGFYRAYAALLGPFGVDGEALLLWPRLLTLLGAGLGMVLFLQVAVRIARPQDRLGWAALVALAFTTWFGTQFTSWWVISIRPDLWAACLALLGLKLALGVGEPPSRGRLLFASLAFFAAWSFKQSTVWLLAGSVFACVLAGNFVAAVVLALPCASLMGLTLAVGGELYRLNLIEAPRTSEFVLKLALEVLTRTLPQNLWVFTFFVLAPLLREVGLRSAYRAGTPAHRTIVVAALTATAFGVLALGREGSNKNHLLEGYIACALASWAGLAELRRAHAARWGGLLVALGMLVPYAAMPWLQLARPTSFGRIVLCSEASAQELARFSAEVARLPRPLYSEEEIQSLPWHSSGGRYPALVIDATWYGLARRKLLPQFPFDLLASGRFRSVLYPAGHRDLDRLEADGAECALVSAAPFGLRYVACTLPPP
jgi:hypothetical protein